MTALPKSDKHYYVPELHSQILSDSGKYQESNEILLKIITFRKKDYLFRRIAENYLKMSMVNKAECYSQKAISMNKRNYKNYLTLGIALKEKTMYKSAIDNFEKARLAKQRQYKLDCSEAIVLIDDINRLTNNSPTDIPMVESVHNVHVHEGQVIKYNQNKGYGFIKDFQSKENIFFHISNFPLKEAMIGQEVKYEIEQTSKGEKAINIVI